MQNVCQNFYLEVKENTRFLCSKILQLEYWEVRIVGLLRYQNIAPFHLISNTMYQTNPAENCHLTVKKLPKTWHFFKKNWQKFSFFSTKLPMEGQLAISTCVCVYPWICFTSFVLHGYNQVNQSWTFEMLALLGL